MIEQPTDTDRLGRLESAGTGWLLIFERALAHPVARVWPAITEPEQRAAWFPTLIDGLWAAGSPLAFGFPAGQGPDFTGEVIAVDPPRVLEFRWGPDRLRFALRPDPEGTGCLLTLTVALDQLGGAARDAAGWHVCLDALSARLDPGGEPAGLEPVTGVTPEWVAAHARYVERFGPQAATLGPPPGM
jgi:uncharacterized protein YndB with AHSA1/START domain